MKVSFMFPIEEVLKKSVVMIAKPSPDFDFTPNLEDTYVATPIGTGVLVGYKDISFCVTARHVIFNNKHPIINPIILTNNKNPKIPPSGRFSTQLQELGFGWVPYPNSEIDLAATKMSVNSYEDCLAVYEDRYRLYDELKESSEVFIFGARAPPIHTLRTLRRIPINFVLS